jgi:hypothetical protein
MGLVSGFAAVAKGEDHDLFAVVVIQDDIGALAELEYPFPRSGGIANSPLR